MRIIDYNLQTAVDGNNNNKISSFNDIATHHLLKLAEVICESENATGDGNPEI